MPKVNLYETTYGGVDVETGESLPDPQPRRISVGWSKGQDAQLGIGWVDPTKRAAETREGRTSVGGDYIASAEVEDETGKVWLSQWLTLDRHLINQLIRELRKARDEAFGRDE